MIWNGKGWYYLIVKKLSALWRGMMLKHDHGFYCLNCLHTFRIKKKLEWHKKVCKNKDFCGVVMPSEDTKNLHFK